MNLIDGDWKGYWDREHEFVELGLSLWLLANFIFCMGLILNLSV